MIKNGKAWFGYGFWLKAEPKAVTVYIYGEEARTYYRDGNENEKLIYEDLVERFSDREPYFSRKLCMAAARLIVSGKVTCNN